VSNLFVIFWLQKRLLLEFPPTRIFTRYHTTNADFYPEVSILFPFSLTTLKPLLFLFCSPPPPTTMAAAVSLSSPAAAVSVSSPAAAVSVSSPAASVSVSSPAAAVSLSSPAASVSVSSPAASVSVSVSSNFTAWTGNMWTALAAVCPEASLLLMGRGNKRKEHCPRQSLLRVYGTLERLYATHGPHCNTITASAQAASALHKRKVADDKKWAEVMRKVTWSAMERFPRYVDLEEEGQSLLHLDLSDGKRRRVVVTYIASWPPRSPRNQQFSWRGAFLQWRGRHAAADVSKALTQQEWLVFCLCEKKSALLRRFFNQAGKDVLKMIFALL